LFILDGVEEVKGDDFFDISRDGLTGQLTKTDIDVDFLIFEGDDGYLSVGSGG